MTHTVSHRQAGVVKANVAGLIRHTFRDVDKSNGLETQHSNERIIPERTHLNESVLFVDGQEVELSSSRQILDELDSRLEKAGGTRTNKKTGKVSRVAVREDAKVVRDIVLQLDPKFSRSSEFLVDEENEEHQQEVRRLLAEMVDHYADVYGRKNLLASSLHLDETSPHIHLMVTPIDEEGRVRQESFIKAGRGSKSGMAENDRAMRSRLKGAGYDVDPKPRGANRSHMSIDEYAKWQDRIEELEAREIEVEDREVGQRKRGSTQNKNKVWLDKQKAAHDAREADLSQREVSVVTREAQAKKVAQNGSQALRKGQELWAKAKAEGQAAQDAKMAFKEGSARAFAVERDALALIKEIDEGTRLAPKKRYDEKIRPASKQRVQSVRNFNTWAEDDKPKADEWQYGDD